MTPLHPRPPYTCRPGFGSAAPPLASCEAVEPGFDARAPQRRFGPRNRRREVGADDLHVWIETRQAILTLGLASLLRDLGMVVDPQITKATQVALVDVSHGRRPFPAPPEGVAALALVCDQKRELPLLLKRGYRGYLRSDTDAEHLGRAIVAVARGEVWAERRVLLAMSQQPDSRSVTDREREVLALLEEGLSNQEIGDRLGITISTTKSHVTALLRKLGARSRLELVVNHTNGD